MNSDKILREFKKLYAEYREFDRKKIPLCAAETFVSPFVKQALSSEFEGKYVMGSEFNRVEGDFIGSDYLRKVYVLVGEQCRRMFGTKYVDARPLTGMNCDMLLLMSLAERGDRVLLSTPEQGGHASVPLILSRLGVQYDSVPYDFEHFQIDYEQTDELLATGKYSFVMFCQSDLIQPPDIAKLHIPQNVTLLYDGTQTLGMIACGILPNPIAESDNSFLFGGTHKTLPGATCGLILSNNDAFEKIDKQINPDYLRNTQVNNIAGLLLALIEQDAVGKPYQQKTVELANLLGAQLAQRGFRVAQIADGVYTKTHQIFILSDKAQSETLYRNGVKYGVTLNSKHKRLFGDYGTRLGAQEIARYNWGREKIALLADLIALLSRSNPDEKCVCKIIETLSQRKTPHFCLEDNFMTTK